MRGINRVAEEINNRPLKLQKMAGRCAACLLLSGVRIAVALDNKQKANLALVKLSAMCGASSGGRVINENEITYGVRGEIFEALKVA